MINAAMTPGTQPQSVSRNTMSIEPQPRSITASGGKIMARMTWRQDMVVLFLIMNYIFHQCCGRTVSFSQRHVLLKTWDKP